MILLQMLIIFRWGNTPLDEAVKCGSESMVMLLEDAKSQELSKFPQRAQEIQGRISLQIYISQELIQQ